MKYSVRNVGLFALIASVGAIACSSAGNSREAQDTEPSAYDSDPVEPADSPETYECYRDNDGDGLGAGTMFKRSAPCGTGYSAKTGDCNDKDPTVTATITCYADSDADGYGAGAALQVCALSCKAPYSANNKDCNDKDSHVATASTVCYTDNDRDGLGGTMQKVCGSTCPTGMVTNGSDCSGATYCFEKTGTLDLTIDSFKITFSPDDQDEPDQTMSGDSSEMSTSRAIGTVSRDGALKFAKKDFQIVYSYVEKDVGIKVGSLSVTKDVQVTTTLTANSDITTKIDPETGHITKLVGDLKVTIAADVIGMDLSATCSESAISVELSTSSPYDSKSGKLALKSSPFVIQETSGSAGCGQLNKQAGLPGTGILQLTATAKPGFPISSWPRL